MNEQTDEVPADKKSTNKATMDQPQEEFIEPDPTRVNRDAEDEEANKKTKVMPASTTND
jgi:hypothetical protein